MGFFRVMASLRFLQLRCPVCFPAGELEVCSASELSSYSESMQDRKTAVFHGTRSIVKGRDGSNRARSGEQLRREEIAQLFLLPIPLIYYMCPFSLALLIPFLQVSFLSFPHCTEFQNTDLLRACRKIFSSMGLKFRCSHLYITFF